VYKHVCVLFPHISALSSVAQNYSAEAMRKIFMKTEIAALLK